ncbi:MAG: hypothetical protein HY814_14240 [Candidatus Riflebacteria bacterium]|nr:hypothetical protein [Candidatus Riflebacteria bacterium]
MADTLGTATAKVRALLGDLDAQQYDDAFLVSYVGMAQSQLDLRLAAKGIERYRLQQTVTVPAGVTALTTTSTPPLPSDLIQPIVLHERRSGSMNANEWTAMTQIREDLPNVEASESLGVWSWQGGAIRFVGATTGREVQIDYVTAPVEVALLSDTLPSSNTAEAVAFLACALVMLPAGELEMHGTFLALYEREFTKLYEMGIRQKQRRPGRRKFYSSGPRGRLPYIT